jgi:asparagine synthase (glutamine-hydrolysing)
MCGIVGVLNLNDRPPVDKTVLCQMLGMIRHRGPDDFGIYRNRHVGLGSARLSIIDLEGGQQPISNEDETTWIVFNGEIFNYVELRPRLEQCGHRFSTNTDTEVVLHLYEDHGPACLKWLNGQFAIAIYDSRALWDAHLFLARDRLGIRPLFYTVSDGRLVFGSEIKAMLAHPTVRAEIDVTALDQIFTFWSTLSPRTAFSHIKDIPPGHYLLAHGGDPIDSISTQSYWMLDFGQKLDAVRKKEDCLEEFESLLVDATRLRLRADVPIGAYLSGGLDSSITTSIVRKHSSNRLDTFSIAFEDPEFDESRFQQQMSALLGTNHRVAYCTGADIGRAFPDVVWHTETPILRTSPAPMFLLSGLVHKHELKVVLTGEGADEILAGYGVFKEGKVRRFWAKNPDSQMRPLLLRRLYPYISGLSDGHDGRFPSPAYLAAFFGKGLSNTDSAFYSHAIRWANTARIRRFLLQPDMGRLGPGPTHPSGHQDSIPVPAAFFDWSHLAQAQYLEMSIFMAQYLLSSQGDRMLAAHSVEGRFPFLDHRVVEFCNRLPPELKLRGLTEKWLLKQLGRKLVPAEIWQRPKQPYRAPIHRSFFGENAPAYVRELLSEGVLRETGLFNPAAVTRLKRKAERSMRLSEVDSMALVGVLSTQLVHHHFVRAFRVASLRADDRVKVVDRTWRADAVPSIQFGHTMEANRSPV